jgi:hypothetical protein
MRSGRFMEVIVEGPFELAKGFCHGFLAARGILSKGRCYFCREHRIHSESFAQQLLQWTGVKENLTHVLVEEALLREITEALERAGGELDLAVKSVQGVLGASFSFSFKVFVEEQGRAIKSIFEELPQGLVMDEGYDSVEQKWTERTPDLEAYAPVHDYEYRGSGTVRGDLEAILDLYERAMGESMVHLEPIELELETTE